MTNKAKQVGPIGLDEIHMRIKRGCIYRDNEYLVETGNKKCNKCCDILDSYAIHRHAIVSTNEKANLAYFNAAEVRQAVIDAVGEDKLKEYEIDLEKDHLLLKVGDRIFDYSNYTKSKHKRTFYKASMVEDSDIFVGGELYTFTIVSKKLKSLPNKFIRSRSELEAARNKTTHPNLMEILPIHNILNNLSNNMDYETIHEIEMKDSDGNNTALEQYLTYWDDLDQPEEKQETVINGDILAGPRFKRVQAVEDSDTPDTEVTPRKKSRSTLKRSTPDYTQAVARDACQYCERMILKTSKFCSFCGQSAVKPLIRICATPLCCEVLKSGWSYCAKCGMKVTGNFSLVFTVSTFGN